MKKTCFSIARIFLAAILTLSLLASLGGCMIFNPATGDGSTQSSEESNTETNDTVTNSGRYRYWSSDISEAAIEIDEEGNSAKFYSLQTGYYAYYAVDEATYSLKGTSFVLTLNGTDYTFVYDDNENTLSIPNTDETQDDIVYTAMEDAPTPHPSYTFPTFADLSFPSSFTLGSLDFDVIREFSLEEAKIKIAIDYYENGLETFPKITDRAIQRGDYVSIDYIGKMGGEYIQNSGHNDQPVAIIMHPENIDGITYPAEFIEALVGHNVGDYFEVTITYPEGHQYAGKTAIFEVTVKAIYDTVLTMNQLNNYENFEFESYDAYLLDTAKTLASHLAIPHLVDTSNAIEALPEESYQFFYQEFLDEAHRTALRDYKMEYERYLNITGQTEELFLEKAKAQASDYMMAYYVAKQNNLTWTEEQYKTQYDSMVLTLVQNGINQDKAKELVESQQLNLLKANLTYQIASEFLCNSAFAPQAK